MNNKLMTSLFESFDLMNSPSLSLNWLIIIIPMMLFFNFWLIPSRLMMIWNLIMKLIFKEFNLLLSKFESNIIFFLMIMLFIFTMNFFGLIPYIFTITSHSCFNLSLSLPLWFSVMFFIMFKNTKKFLSHLVPMNTPFLLMNFMVIIELISSIIRPLTLMIRLTANLIAGHLLMILLSNFLSTLNLMYMMFSILLIHNLLTILELSMSLIQAYVFAMLSVLYFNESK